MGDPVSWMPSVKCRVYRIGDPVSCTAQVSPWGLVQGRLPRMPRGVHCLFKPVGEPACLRREVEVRPGVGGQILPSRGPQAAGVGDPIHGVQGSWFPVLLRESSPGGGGSGAHGEDPLPHLVAFQRGKVGYESQERVGSVNGDEAL